MSNTANTTRSRGRPAFPSTRKQERRLREEGRASVGFGENRGVSEATARARLYLIANRVGIPVTTHKVSRGAVQYIEARARIEGDEAEQAPEAAEA